VALNILVRTEKAIKLHPIALLIALALIGALLVGVTEEARAAGVERTCGPNEADARTARSPIVTTMCINGNIVRTRGSIKIGALRP
jgi:hypothetical protein